MRFQESETVELKAEVTDEIKKEIVAFANGDGGKLYIGVADDGTVLGPVSYTHLDVYKRQPFPGTGS